MSDQVLPFTQAGLDEVFSPSRIRSQAQKLKDFCEAGEGSFVLHEEKLPQVIEYVNKVIDTRHPKGEIPYHSREGHFQVGGVDRLARLNEVLKGIDRLEKVRAKLDLMIVSVLLDAGAGTQWQYLETATGKLVSRSEGLAVASLDMFLRGAFSSEPQTKWQADGGGLLHLTKERLSEGFQVSVGNPLVGVDGRLSLMHSLGHVVEEDKEVFGGFYSRPGHILDLLMRKYPNQKLPASDLLKLLLKSLSPIWPDRVRMGTFNLGDVWHHPALGGRDSWEGLQPFHKLTQWLTYSLLSPLEEAGFEVIGLNDLTGLPEYRNGGLLVDSGLISLRKPELLDETHRPGSPLVVEWRALTIHYLDSIHKGLCQLRGTSPVDFPLVKALEGGTWWAGRKIANEKRPGGAPPIKLASDGTVF
ncbi:MAG: DUF1688 family protein [Bdellovibrionaceae bacterium]|nr:DUF1688 family protein [Bdellovibrionales bacterium]MCB9083741.1 DUF1688 family protein [Pseudobdellovibrionaceae bacterium]